MAGRLLGIGLATVAGVAIGVSTFDSALKEQREKRLREEYNRDVAAAAMAKNEGAAPAQLESVKTQSNLVSPSHENKPETETSGLASMLGLWAWKKKSDTASNAEPIKKPDTNGSGR